MKNTKKNFNKFSSRNSLRERQKRELLKLASETGTGTSYAKIKFTDSAYGRKKSGSETVRDGILSESGYGYGFVRVEGEGRDIFIPDGRLGEALDGDTVRVKYKKYRNERGEIKTEGRITEILEYGSPNVVGTVEVDIVRIGRARVAKLYIIPDSRKIGRRIYIRESAGANEGDKVSAKILRGSNTYELFADVLVCFGKAESLGANYLSILNECEIETEFSGEELRQAEEAAKEPIDDTGRESVDGVVFTIDSESAKDLDDAVSLKVKDGGGYTLGVHIADVSHYVKEKTALDRLVMRRGTSVYFTDKVVPMLPTALSNGACSLNPGEKKLTLSLFAELSETGEILSAEIKKTVIVSKIKGIYSEINEIFRGEAGEYLTEKYRDIIPTLKDMHSLYLILKKKSERRGALELDSPEPEIILDENGAPIDIIKRERGDAERLIEQFMLTANEAVATVLLEKGLPSVFRVHEKPPYDKLESFLDYAKRLGLKTGGIDPEASGSSALSSLLSEAEEKGISEPVSYALLRSLSKAEYSEIHKAHYGLGIENYCHFTSPIRRLSDLAVHRIIHKCLLSDAPCQKYASYAKRAAAAATEGEVRAVNAERKIDDLYRVLYMKEKVGEIFMGTVSSLTQFGIFVTLENTCEGLIPISTVDGTYFEDALTVKGRGREFSIGDKISVRLEEADISRGKLRFSYLGGER